MPSDYPQAIKLLQKGFGDNDCIIRLFLSGCVTLVIALLFKFGISVPLFKYNILVPIAKPHLVKIPC